MPRIITTAITLALVFGLGGALQAAPLLVVDPLEFDFGFAPQNSKVCRIFQLRNDGDDTLLITRVIPGCGCTQMPLKDSSLAPGESTQLEIIFSTGHYSGPITKRPRIETNETEPSKFIAIQTNVAQRPDSTSPLVIRPYKLDLSQFGEKVRDETVFTLTNVSESDLGVSLVSCPTEMMTVDLPKVVPAGGSSQGVVKLTSAGIDGSMETSITLQVDDSAKTRFTVPIKRTVKAPRQVASEATTTGK